MEKTSMRKQNYKKEIWGGNLTKKKRTGGHKTVKRGRE